MPVDDARLTEDDLAVMYLGVSAHSMAWDDDGRELVSVVAVRSRGNPLHILELLKLLQLVLHLPPAGRQIRGAHSRWRRRRHHAAVITAAVGQPDRQSRTQALQQAAGAECLSLPRAVRHRDWRRSPR